MLMLLYCHIW